MTTHTIRRVSDLRIQHMCEYRYVLMKMIGETDSCLASAGSELHGMAASRPRHQTPVLPWILMAALMALVTCMLLG
ncbi:MAG: hypothetical protein QXS20_03025 [Candidatus Thorarchaeota archaeon]